MLYLVCLLAFGPLMTVFTKDSEPCQRQPHGFSHRHGERTPKLVMSADKDVVEVKRTTSALARESVSA